MESEAKSAVLIIIVIMITINIHDKILPVYHSGLWLLSKRRKDTKTDSLKLSTLLGYRRDGDEDKDDEDEDISDEESQQQE